MIVTPEPEKRGRAKVDSQSDVEMAQRASQGDPVARRQLVTHLMNRVRSTTRYLAGGHPDAEDYAQLAFIEILQSVASYRGDSTLESWAEKITVRTAMRCIKKQRWRGQYMIVNSEYEGRQDAGVEEQVVNRRVMRRFAEILGTFKPRFRAAMMLKLVYGHSISEISEITDTSEFTVKYLLRVGRKKLRRQIKHDPLLREWIGDEGS
ncbi:MAG: RNA polymerase sigma factor [Deltaproteobacteria bacterium]|nr:RNA polymerase sigma factor [Deltaproteobacteria bacterium]